MIASAADEGSPSLPPWPDRVSISQDAESTEGQQRPHSGAELTSPTEDMTSPGDVIRQPIFKELPTQGREGQVQTGKLARVKEDRWEGEVHGRVHEDRDALLAVLETLNLVKQKTLKELGEEENTDCVTSSEEESDEEEGVRAEAESDPGTSINLRNRSVNKETKKKLGG